MGRKQCKKAPRVQNAGGMNRDRLWKVYKCFKERREQIDDVNKRFECSEFGYPTLLQLSIYKDDEEFIDYLLSRKDIQVNITNKIWGSTVDVATEQENLPVVKKLLEAGADLTTMVPKSSLKRTPFCLIIMFADFNEEISNLLINHGASVDDVCLLVQGSDPWTPIEVAIRFNIGALEYLLNHCAVIHRSFKLYNDYLPFLTYGFGVFKFEKTQVMKKAFESVFKRFIVIYHAANFDVGDFHLNAVQFDQSFNTLRRECHIEVQLMKRLLVDNSNINYYDLLHSSTERAALELMHIDITKDAMLANAGKLKNYKTMMTFKIDKICYRVRMIKKYSPLVANYFHALPTTLIDIMVHYLTIPDMVNIAIALKKLV